MKNMKMIILPLLILSIGTFFVVRNFQKIEKGRSFSSIKTPDVVTPILLQIKDIKSVTQVEPSLTNIATSLRKQTSHKEALIVADMVDLLKYSKGFIYRFKTILETTSLVASTSMSFFKKIKQQIPENLQHLHALFNYLFLQDKNATAYATISEAQNDLIEKTVKRLKSVVEKLSFSLKKYPLNKGPVDLFKIDLTLVGGNSQNLIPQRFKQISITSTHLHILKSKLEKLISAAYYIASYDLDLAPKFYTKVSKSSARKLAMIKILHRDDRMKSGNKIALRKNFFRKLDSPKFDSLLKLRDVAKKENYLMESKNWLIKGLKSELSTIIAIEENNPRVKSILVSSDIFGHYKNKSAHFLNETIINLESATPVSFISPIDNIEFKILPNIIFDVNKVSNLKDFIPNDYISEKKISIGEKKNILNLDYGKAISWKDPTFAGLLPKNTNDKLGKKTYDLMAYPATTFIGTWLKLFQ